MNQANDATCKTAQNGIVTCESTSTIVTKHLKDVVQVTCITHFDDGQTDITRKRACVVLVPHGTLESVTHMSFLDGSSLNCMVQCTVYNIFIPVYKTNDTCYVNLYRYVGYLCH